MLRRFDENLESKNDIKALIVYHRVDFDGVFSCCLAERFLDETPGCLEYEILGYTYGDEIPNFKYYIESEGINYIIISDVSFSTDIMLYLKEKYDNKEIGLTWIDHHITSIVDSEKNKYDDIPGVRGVERAACEYSWKYFYPNEICPEVIEYMSAYDIWDKTRFDWENSVLPLQHALFDKYGVSETKIMDDFGKLLYMDEPELENLISYGRKLLNFKRKGWKAAIKNYSFEITVAGKYRGIAILSTEFSSLLFGDKSVEYDVMCVMNRKNNDCYCFSLYVDPSKTIDFNAGEYLKEKYNGGGHQKAAGGKLNFDQFVEFMKNRSL